MNCRTKIRDVVSITCLFAKMLSGKSLSYKVLPKEAVKGICTIDNGGNTGIRKEVEIANADMIMAYLKNVRSQIMKKQEVS